MKRKKKTETITIRLSPKELQYMKQLAEHYNEGNLSELIVETLMRRKIQGEKQ